MKNVMFGKEQTYKVYPKKVKVKIKSIYTALVHGHGTNAIRIVGMRHLASKNQINLYSVGPMTMGLMLKELLACAT